MSESPQPEPKTVASGAPSKKPVRLGKLRFSMAQFLVSLVLLFVVTPFIEDLPRGDAIESVLLTVVLLSGVMVVSRGHGHLIVAAVLLVPAIIARWLNQFRPDLMPPEFHIIATLLFMSFLLWQLLQFIFMAPRVDSEVLCAGVAGYLLVGLVWMIAYRLVAVLNPADATHPGAFSYNIGGASTHALQGFDAYYFSFITLTTVGYGDITPLSHEARALAMSEAIIGTLYIALLISRLVALYSSQSSSSSTTKNQDQ